MSSTMSRSIRLPQRPAFCLRHPSFLVVSTYQLESSTERAGALHFLSPTLEELHIHPTPSGVFRFLFPRADLCVSALTDGSIYSTSLTDANFTSTALPVSSNMLLDVSCHDDVTMTTDNKGSVYVVDTATSKITAEWQGHKLPFTGEACEVWTCAISEHGACSGGEDAVLRLWDVRTAAASPAGVCKVFEAGVTFTHWMDQHTLLTGSYDQKIRLLDTRNLKQPCKEIETAGGVWHIEKTEHDGLVRYVAACMYGGWAMYNEEFDVIATDELAGKELLYGAALLPTAQVAYTTFNDYTVTLSDEICLSK